MPQLCQARRCRRSGPAIEMVGAALNALREMQYFLSGTGELTRSRSLTQHTGDLSIMLGTGHSRRLHHRRQNTRAHKICFVRDRRRARLRGRSLWITPTPIGTAPICMGIVPPDAPATVRVPVRNAVTPMPIARLVAPVGSMPTVSAAVPDQFDRRRRAQLGRGSAWRVQRSRLHRRGPEDQPAQECDDRHAHLCLQRKT